MMKENTNTNNNEDKTFNEVYNDLLLEYGHHQPWLYSNNVRASKHSKSIMSSDQRKHQNVLRREYQSKNPLVNTIFTTKSERMVMGPQLENLLNDYGMSYEEGAIKGLGKGVKLFMFTNAQGNKVGMAHHRDKSSKYEKHPFNKKSPTYQGNPYVKED